MHATEDDIGSRTRGDIMQQIFIELYNYVPAWANALKTSGPISVKESYRGRHELKSPVSDVIAYGRTPTRRIAVRLNDFFCVYRVPSAEFQREFERQVTASGCTITSSR